MADVLSFNEYTFKVEGLHCIKCIRRVQSVAGRFESIKGLKVSLGNQLVTAKADNLFPVEDFISELGAKGIGVSSFAKNKGSLGLNKKSLMQIGVAGACAGNIMLLAAAEYAGASIPGWPYIFKSLSFLFFLPIFFYSALPLYYNTLLSLKVRKVSIDAPIALAIVGGACLSTYNLIFNNQSQVYFDSLAMFVFFLLASRYIVQEIQSRYTREVSTEDVFNQTRCYLDRGGVLTAIDNDKVKVGETVFVENGQYIPFDGSVKSDEAVISDAFYSGEAYPKNIQAMGEVFAGSKNMGPGFYMEVESLANETRLSKIIEMLNRSLSSKTYISNLADRGAKFLTIMIVLSSATIMTYFSLYELNLEEGINRALALLVVACPCGLAIATPLIQTLAVKNAIKKSLLIKDVSVLESLQGVKSVIFDKTGTLTKGDIVVSNCYPCEPSEFEKKIIFNLERESEHPIAKSLKKYVGERQRIEFKDYREEAGIGVSGEFDNIVYSLLSSGGEEKSILFSANKEVLITFTLDDEVDPQAVSLVSFLKDKADIFMISGDKQREALKVAKEVGIQRENVYYEKSPLQKKEIVKKLDQKSLYLGDGINDSLAMSQSLVSISMKSSAEVAFKASQVHILSGGLSALRELFKISRISIFSMKTIIAVSIIYNLAFAVLAGLGFIKPLVAVVIMPISSISVTLLGLFLMSSKLSVLNGVKS